MSQRAIDLSKRIESFNADLVSFVEKLSAEEWEKPLNGKDGRWVSRPTISGRLIFH
jgi:hypothetical protein